MLTQSVTLTYYVTCFPIWLKVVQNCSEDSFTSNKVSLNARRVKKDERTVSFFVSSVSPWLHLPLYSSCLSLDAINRFWYNNGYFVSIKCNFMTQLCTKFTEYQPKDVKTLKPYLL